MNEKIFLSSPHMGGKEQKYVQEAFDTNWVAPLGPNVNGFENDLAQYLSTEHIESLHVACLSSGTAALHLALIMSGVTAGDEVICQSMTFSASANPIIYQGATPVFVDSEVDTWDMCPFALQEAIEDRISKGKKPKAIIVVHLYGMPAKMAEIMAIAKEYDIKLIEDAAEALGSTYKGQKCGTFGDFGILSFNGNKIITTSGGGALVCHSAEDKEQAIFLSTQARDEAPHYQHSQIGYNYRMSNIVAGIGRGQMEVLDERVKQRRSNHDFYQRLINDIDGLSMFVEPNEDYFSNYWLSCLTIDESVVGFSREKLRLIMQSDNIESRPLWKPMHLQPVFESMSSFKNGISEELFNKGLCLPSGSNLSEEDRQRIWKSMYKLIKS